MCWRGWGGQRGREGAPTAPYILHLERGCKSKYGVETAFTLLSGVNVSEASMWGVCLAGGGGEVRALARKRTAFGQQNSPCLPFPPHLHLFLKFSGHVSFLLPGGKKKKNQLAIGES